MLKHNLPVVLAAGLEARSPVRTDGTFEIAVKAAEQALWRDLRTKSR